MSLPGESFGSLGKTPSKLLFFVTIRMENTGASVSIFGRNFVIRTRTVAISMTVPRIRKLHCQSQKIRVDFLCTSTWSCDDGVKHTLIETLVVRPYCKT